MRLCCVLLPHLCRSGAEVRITDLERELRRQQERAEAASSTLAAAERQLESAAAREEGGARGASVCAVCC